MATARLCATVEHAAVMTVLCCDDDTGLWGTEQGVVECRVKRGQIGTVSGHKGRIIIVQESCCEAQDGASLGNKRANSVQRSSVRVEQ